MADIFPKLGSSVLDAVPWGNEKLGSLNPNLIHLSEYAFWVGDDHVSSILYIFVSVTSAGLCSSFCGERGARKILLV